MKGPNQAVHALVLQEIHQFKPSALVIECQTGEGGMNASQDIVVLTDQLGLQSRSL